MDSQNKDQTTPQSSFSFVFPPAHTVTISSPADSGNIALIRHIAQFHFRLTVLNDGTRTNHPVNSKSWFYFEVQGLPKGAKGKFVVTRVQALSPVFYSKYSKCYRPVFRKNKGEWKRVDSEVQLIMRENEQLECVIEYNFSQQGEIVEFAFCYPYPYQKYVEFINGLTDNLFSPLFYFHSEILCYSSQHLPVHLLTITSHDRAHQHSHEPPFSQPMFPERKRPLRFDKPVVFITGRVHPGETPASYAMQGVIQFLLDKKDARAMLLRKMFVFMIVPMINVDGVIHGHFRMDAFGKNLNRFYQSPSMTKHPVIYSIKQLISTLSSQNRLTFYFDLHAHNSKKGSFIYGNAFQQFVEQVESQVYCKLMGLNHAGFQYEECNFSEKQMMVKDRNDEITKEGCGRVVVHKETGIIHSYSVECGIISANQIKILPQLSNPQFFIQKYHLVKDPMEDNLYHQKMEKTGDDSIMFTEDTYRNLGKNLMVSILDVYDKNPYNRIYSTKYKSMDVLRRVTAFQIFHQAQRFRRYEKFVFGKVKNINPLIQQVLNNKLHYQKLSGLYFYEDSQLRGINWPSKIIGLQKPVKFTPSSKVKKYRSMLEQKNSEENLALTKGKQIPKTQQKENEYEKNKQEENSEMSSETQAENQEPIQSLCELFHQDQDEMMNKLAKNQLNENDLKQIQQKIKNKSLYRTSNCQISINQQSPQQFKDSNIKVQRIHEFISNAKISPIKYRISKKFISINSEEMAQQSNKEDTQQGIQVVTLLNEPNQSSKFNAAEQFRKNIYETIKQQIRAGLRKEYQKKKTTHSKGKFEFGQLFRNNYRVRSTNQDDNKRLKSKVRFPSLGTNMYIMTNSSKVIAKK